MNTRRHKNAIRRGFSFLELQVALILLGIALMGLVPLVVMQSKQLKALEYRWNPDWEDEADHDYWIDPYIADPEFDGPVYDFVPAAVEGCSQANAWARKLGAPAQLRPRGAGDTPASATASGNVVNNSVRITSISAMNSQTAKATVSVEVPPEEEP